MPKTTSQCSNALCCPTNSPKSQNIKFTLLKQRKAAKKLKPENVCVYARKMTLKINDQNKFNTFFVHQLIYKLTNCYGSNGWFT